MAVLNVPKVTFKGSNADGYDPDSDDDDDVGSGSAAGGAGDDAVLLGFVDGALGQEDAGRCEVSRLGGPAVRLPRPSCTVPPADGLYTQVSLPFVSTAPSPADLACRGCGEPLHLLTQIYCPRHDDVYDRILHVFGCLRRKCQTQDPRRAR